MFGVVSYSKGRHRLRYGRPMGKELGITICIESAMIRRSTEKRRRLSRERRRRGVNAVARRSVICAAV